LVAVTRLAMVARAPASSGANTGAAGRDEQGRLTEDEAEQQPGAEREREGNAHFDRWRAAFG
jgi:ribosomal protein L12E/L44/L45/RPP1/RPP2